MEGYTRYYPAPLLTEVFDKASGKTSYGSAGTYYHRYRDLTCSAIVRSNFHDPNPWTFNKRMRENNMHAWYENSVQRITYDGPYWNMPEGLNTWHASELSWADQKALENLMDSIRGATNVSVDLFQIRQTLRLKSQIAGIIKRTRLLVKKLGPKPDLIKIPGNVWLGYVYGVKPTLQSIYDIVVFTKNHYYGLSKMYTGRHTCTRNDVVRIENYLDGTWRARVNISSSVRVLYKVRLEIPDEPLTQAARLTSLNPASIAWELMPYSFVIDWFLNIGGYLRDLETAVVYGRFFKSGFRTESWRYSGDLAGTRKAVPSATVGGYHVCTSLDVHSGRSVLSGIPYPVPPMLHPSLGATRMVNAAALLTTFIRR